MIALLVVLPPLGVVLVWLTGWRRAAKLIATAVAALWFIAPLVSPNNDTGDAAPTVASSPAAQQEKRAYTKFADYTSMPLDDAKRAATDDGLTTTSHDASEQDAGQWDDSAWTVCFQSPTRVKSDTTPGSTTIDFGVVRTGLSCPAADNQAVDYKEMPDVVGMTYADAEKKIIDETAITTISAPSAYLDVDDPAHPDAWKVCTQSPEADTKVTRPDSTSVELDVVKAGTACPSGDDLYLHDHEHRDRHTDTGTSSSGSNDSSSNDSPSVSYDNCTAARAAGAAPIHRGEPGYAPHLDRDGDGIGCDT
ncbi:excalibur calcium-binding domain-containing protein [Streptomyces sp. NPDC102360]|uniref:excalibur calcium-binding domain-containing protein n=1 Tax=Streptomyces sp. NPDC102360 TaxID=3366160 RepID=UPI00382365A5